MKTIITTQYGSPKVLKLTEADKPTPKANEILIQIKASSVTAADSMMRKGEPYYGRLFIGLTKPKNPVPGTGFSGIVVSAGKEVSAFSIGDAVFGEIVLGPGTNCEYVCVPEDGVVLKKPENISYAQAAPVCDGALTSMNFLKSIANMKQGEKILINGASGSLGSAAVQLAKILGAEVTGVCSTSNIDLVKGFGADHVIDYTKSNFATQGELYDIIYDTIGTLSFSASKKALTSEGQFISPVLGVPLLYQMIKTGISGRKKAKFSATGLKPIPELKILFLELKGFLEKGLLTTWIDKTYALEEIALAHQYVDSGRKKGNIVLINSL
jgi:NADPH:quinone reductase-like Zn-dependent oxidoreductase